LYRRPGVVAVSICVEIPCNIACAGQQIRESTTTRHGAAARITDAKVQHMPEQVSPHIGLRAWTAQRTHQKADANISNQHNSGCFESIGMPKSSFALFIARRQSVRYGKYSHESAALPFMWSVQRNMHSSLIQLFCTKHAQWARLCTLGKVSTESVRSLRDPYRWPPSVMHLATATDRCQET